MTRGRAASPGLMAVALVSSTAMFGGGMAQSAPETPETRRSGARPPATFAVAVENVNVDVLVTRGGRPADGLTGADFVVKDNRVRQQVEVVGRSGTAVDAVLVLDISTSVRGERIEALRRAAHAFVDALWTGDSVTVLVFGTDLRVAAPAGVPRAAAHAAIDRLEGAGATTLVDAVCAALLLTDPRRGRPLLVVFSDGVDHGSWLTPEEALAAAKSEDVVIDYVEAEGALTFLQPIAEATGGRGWAAKSWDRLARAFVDALEEFRSRYRLRYEPSGVARPGWHALSVGLAPGVDGKVRARPGYLVPGDRDAR